MSDGGWNPDLLKQHYDERLGQIAHDLDGFPEKYATLEDFKILRTLIEDIRADHVHRREIEEIKSQQHEASGRRSTIVLALSVVMTLLGIMFALAWSSQPTTAEIRSQILVESPWLQDRPAIEKRLAALEGAILASHNTLVQHAAGDKELVIRLTAIEKLDQFFCRSRTVKGLAAC